MSLQPEDKVIIWIISLGIAIGLFLYIGGNITGAIKPSPVLVAVFVAIGFSAAIYRFLGGLEGSGMNIGPAKLAGTAAAFLAITWFLNQSLERQWIPKGESFNPARLSLSPNNWLALDSKSGEPVQVQVLFQDSVIKTIPSRKPDFRNRSLLLDKAPHGNSDFSFSVKALNGQDSWILGGISPRELSKNELFSSFSDEHSNLYTSDRIGPGIEIDIAPELPFLIRTGVFTQNLSRFALVDRATKEILTRSSILLRGGKIFEVNDRPFLIMITEVDHTRPEKKGGQYAKFGVIELDPN